MTKSSLTLKFMKLLLKYNCIHSCQEIFSNSGFQLKILMSHHNNVTILKQLLNFSKINKITYKKLKLSQEVNKKSLTILSTNNGFITNFNVIQVNSGGFFVCKIYI